MFTPAKFRSLACAFALCLAPPVFAEVAPQPYPMFSVSGTGSVEQAPDLATITLGVTHQAKTASEALAQTNAAAAGMLDVLSAAGIEPRDIQTSDLSVQPLWSRYKLSSGTGEGQKITGYSASNRLHVRVRDLDRLGAVLDQVADAGANRFEGLRFGFVAPEPLRDAARREAVADARRKAEELAEAAGVRLGKILSISEHGGGRQQPMMAMEMARADGASVPVMSGEVSMMSTVTLSFEILQE